MYHPGSIWNLKETTVEISRVIDILHVAMFLLRSKRQHLKPQSLVNTKEVFGVQVE